MALDNVRLLINKIRRLNNLNDNGEYDLKLDDLYKELNKEIEASDVKVKVVIKVEKEIKLENIDNWEDWLVDNLIEDYYDSSPEDLIAKDIENDLSYYIDFDEESDITVYNKNGKKIYHKEGGVY